MTRKSVALALAAAIPMRNSHASLAETEAIQRENASRGEPKTGPREADQDLAQRFEREEGQLRAESFQGGIASSAHRCLPAPVLGEALVMECA